MPVFNPTKIKTNGGMAKNVQANIQALGIDCDIITNGELITKTRYVDISESGPLPVNPDFFAKNGGTY